MTTKITREVLESHLNCKYKSHLKLDNRQGSKTDFEQMLLADRKEVRQKVLGKILTPHPELEVARDIALTATTLRARPSLVLDAILEDDVFALTFDGLERIDEPSSLGDFHFIPMLFYEGGKVGKTQKLLLEIHGLLLSQIQGRLPAYGVVWHGRECKLTRVRFSDHLRRAELLLREVKEIAGRGSQPKLILNDHCSVCEFCQRCHNQAVHEDNISLLRGLGEREVTRYARKGIFTVTQLSYTFRLRKQRNRAKPAIPHYPALKALAVRDKKIYVLGTPEIPDSAVKFYLDMEGLPDEGYVYLIGLIVVENGSEHHHSFWADSKDQEADIFEQMLAEVTRHENFVVFSYGSYERTNIKRVRKTANRKKSLDQVLAALINSLSVVYSHIYFPTYSNSLKDIGGCLGFSWNEASASGLQSITWRHRWEDSHDDHLKLKLIEYNREDCAALRRVTDFISGIGMTSCSVVCSGDTQRTPEIASAETITPPLKEHEWFRKNAFIPDFDFVNRRASFDYQRDHVYIRTNDKLKRLSQKKGKRRTKQHFSGHSINRQVKVRCRKCPNCTSTDLRESKRDPIHSRCEIDLRFSTRGIRRYDTEYWSRRYRCQDCGRRFLPSRLKCRTRLRKYTHAFQSWVVYLHVVHRLSFDSIHDLAWEWFGVQIYHGELYSFQSALATYYRGTSQQILARILDGAVVHADETSAKLRGSSGYVWVLATMLDVVYLFNESRDGAFIQKLLASFQGVLVSDFFAAYDGIDCKKQRCLVHLIRDCNDDLLANPWDEELRGLIDHFARTLRSIIETVDERGLQSRFLVQHREDVEKFFTGLVSASFDSEVTEKYRKRLLKNRTELFAFLGHDGVPWNNNNAEYAIKQFARYRDISEGVMTESGLNDYLVLLSIEESCRYRGLSFLRFLMSGEKNFYQYHEQTRKRRPSTPT